MPVNYGAAGELVIVSLGLYENFRGEGLNLCFQKRNTLTGVNLDFKLKMLKEH